jgi:hypothetical protein
MSKPTPPENGAVVLFNNQLEHNHRISLLTTPDFIPIGWVRTISETLITLNELATNLHVGNLNDWRKLHPFRKLLKVITGEYEEYREPMVLHIMRMWVTEHGILDFQLDNTFEPTAVETTIHRTTEHLLTALSIRLEDVCPHTGILLSTQRLEEPKIPTEPPLAALHGDYTKATYTFIQ